MTATEARLLETIANNASPAPETQERRASRYLSRALLWRASSLRRCRHCGRVPRSEDPVTLRLRDGVAGYSGLSHCASVWACPVCGARIRWRRSIEVGQVLAQAVAEGRPLVFVTLTMRHHQAQALALLWGAAAKGWSRATTGKGWVISSENVGGWVRVWEVTYGVNGWHVHVHAVLVLDDDSSRWAEVPEGMYRRWSAGLVAAGLEAPLLIGQDWHVVRGDQAADEVAGYLLKMAEDPAFSLGGELAYSSPGRARASLKTLPPFALLEELSQTGESHLLALWHEWESASKGKRQIGYSRGLRERYGVEEVEDQAIVDEAIGTDADDLVAWTRAGWKELVKVPERMSRLLDVAESAGTPAVIEALDEWGIPWVRP
jgi:uncharacterized membrane protein